MDTLLAFSEIILLYLFYENSDLNNTDDSIIYASGEFLSIITENFKKLRCTKDEVFYYGFFQ